MIGYRGGEGQWAYYLHRLTGIGVFLFLLIHIVDTSFLMAGPDAYNRMMELFALPFFRVGEVFLWAALLYHAINGIRVVLVDAWPKGVEHHRQMWWIGGAIFAAVFLPSSYVMLKGVLW